MVPEPPIMPFIIGGFFHINSSHVLMEEQFFSFSSELIQAKKNRDSSRYFSVRGLELEMTERGERTVKTAKPAALCVSCVHNCKFI